MSGEYKQSDHAPADADLRPQTPDQLIALLGVYATQYSSYTTLLWQVPTLSLTAQAFLLTIALTKGNGDMAKVIVSVLSLIISLASYLLMHDQRGHAINYGELAMALSKKLDLINFLGSVRTDDGEPRVTNAAELWTWRGQDLVIKGHAARMYGIWKNCLLLFIFVDIGIIFSVRIRLVYAVIAAAVVGLATLGFMRVNTKNAHRKSARQLDAEEQRRCQAARVSVWFDRGNPDGNRLGAWIRNASNLPITEVRTVFRDVNKAEPTATVPGITRRTADDIPVIPPQQNAFTEIPPPVQDQIQQADYTVSIEFTDAAGNRWERDSRGGLNPCS